jgi:hypothetical protein
LEAGQTFCPKCGRAIAPIVPPVPGLPFQLENYAGKVRLLAIFWFIYAALSLLSGFAGLVFARSFFSGGFGPWMHGPAMPMWMGPAFFHFIWIFLVLRAGLAIAAGWGLMEHTQWGRLVAIVAAILCLLKIPFGTAMGIWTLVMLLGYRNSSLYDQL